MRNPVRSEAEAFRVAVSSALLAGASILMGYLVSPAYGYAVLGAGVLAALALTLLAKNPDPPQHLREAANSPHPLAPQAKHRVLVVANEALAGSQLRKEIMERVELWPELLVLAPVLTSKPHYWASDFDRELEEARSRLSTTLAWAAEQGLYADGEVGDSDPLTALEDALRRFGPDEVIIATHPPARSNWLESGIVERVRRELELPVTHVVVDAEHGRVEIEPNGRGRFPS